MQRPELSSAGLTWRLLNKDTRALVIRRDRGQCQWPGCTSRAADIHHILARGMGGTQDEEIETDQNLICLCTRHHAQAEGFRAAVLLFWSLAERVGYDYSKPPFSNYERYFDDVTSWCTVGQEGEGWRFYEHRDRSKKSR